MRKLNIVLKAGGAACALGVFIGPMSAVADITVSGDPLGVYPTNNNLLSADIQIDGDAGDLNIFAGRTFILNGFSSPQDGYIDVDGNGTNTDLATTGLIGLGTRANSYGELNVTGGATASASLMVIGASTFLYPLMNGVGKFTLSGGGKASIKSILVGTNEDVNGVGATEGALSVSGQGSALMAESLFVGNAVTGATGSVKIANGAVIETKGVFTDSSGNSSPVGYTEIAEGSTLDVASAGSLLDTEGLIVGSGSYDLAKSVNPSNQPARLSVLNGGSVAASVSQAAFIGAGAQGSMLVDGVGSNFTVTHNPLESFGADLLIGYTDVTPIVVNPPTYQFQFTPGDGSLTISNNASVNVADDIFLGGNEGVLGLGALSGQTVPNSTGVLSVNSGASVTAQNIYVDTGGTLKGNGGIINSNVVIRGGTVAPGTSPGVMTIAGDLTYMTGLFDFEIGGTQLGLFDQLTVQGDLFASGPIDMSLTFVNNFVPQLGDSFDFLNVLGDSSVLSNPAMVNLSVFGLSPSLGINFGFSSGGMLSASVVTGQTAAAVPLPAGLPLMAAAIAGLGGLRLSRRNRRRNAM